MVYSSFVYQFSSLCRGQETCDCGSWQQARGRNYFGQGRVQIFIRLGWIYSRYNMNGIAVLVSLERNSSSVGTCFSDLSSCLLTFQSLIGSQLLLFAHMLIQDRNLREKFCKLRISFLLQTSQRNFLLCAGTSAMSVSSANRIKEKLQKTIKTGKR